MTRKRLVLLATSALFGVFLAGAVAFPKGTDARPAQEEAGAAPAQPEKKKLPREWVWKRQAHDFDHMFRAM